MVLGILVTLKLKATLFWTASITWWSLPRNILGRQMETRGKSDVTAVIIQKILFFIQTLSNTVKNWTESSTFFMLLVIRSETSPKKVKEAKTLQRW